jgi:hypothetical protein
VPIPETTDIAANETIVNRRPTSFQSGKRHDIPLVDAAAFRRAKENCSCKPVAGYCWEMPAPIATDRQPRLNSQATRHLLTTITRTYNFSKAFTEAA